MKIDQNIFKENPNRGAEHPSIQEATLNKFSKIKTVVGIVSGKGGVGKSSITSLLAVQLSRKGYKVGIMDADITGPSIPKAFGFSERLRGDQEGNIVPAQTKGGISVVSMNLMADDPKHAVIWRGPIVATVVRQFWANTNWGELDILLIDMPPGTSDVPLTVFQSIPIDGILMVTTPQDLVSMIVGKAENMAKMMDVTILGLIENMSYIDCPHCQEVIHLFGEGHTAEVAQEMQVPLLDKMPHQAAITSAMDSGETENIIGDYLKKTVSRIIMLIEA